MQMLLIGVHGVSHDFEHVYKNKKNPGFQYFHINYCGFRKIIYLKYYLRFNVKRFRILHI